MLVKVIDQISDDESLDAVWDLYQEAFGDIRAFAVQRHLLHRDEFDAVMRDPRVQKYLVLQDDGAICGLSTYTNDLHAVPLIAPEYFERRWPELCRRRRIWYCGFVGVAKAARDTRAFADLVEAMYLTAANQDGIIALDFCRYNDEVRKMSRVIRLMLHRLSGGVRAECMDAQQFWIYEFPQGDVNAGREDVVDGQGSATDKGGRRPVRQGATAVSAPGPAGVRGGGGARP